MADSLEFRNISKNFGSYQALSDVSFSVKKGEFFSLLGPSGCGKTTLLRLVAGFEQPEDQGKILLNGQDITNLPPHKRPINTVFQNYALFPHLTLYENIAFGLRVAKRSHAEIRREVERMLELIQMSDYAHKRPDEISGGQKQRIAIARALINKPQVLLLDEPLAALDLKLRQKMLLELDLIHDEVGITFLFVTHDQTEAMAVSDHIAVMHRGRVEQIGTPVELYESPKSSFVAAFIGDTNFLDGTLIKKVSTEYSLLQIENFPNVLCFNDKKIAVGEFIHLSMRPEKIHISKDLPQISSSRHNLMQGTVHDVVYKGDHTNFWVAVGDDYRIAVTQQHNRTLLDETPIRWKDKVWIWWHADDGYMLERYHPADENLTQTPSAQVGSVQDIIQEETGIEEEN